LKFFALLAAFMLPITVIASEWIAVTTTAEGDTHYYDSEKLHVQDQAVVYWRKLELRMPLQVGSAFAQLGLYREQIDCGQRNLRTLGYLHYAADGAIIEDVYAPQAPPVAIADGTPARILEDLLCPLVSAAPTAKETRVPSGDGLDPLRQEIEALQAQVRKLRKGLGMQEAAGSAQ
jgi:hypothetical protein